MAAPVIKAIIFDCFGVLYLDTNTSLLSLVSNEQRHLLADVFMGNNYGYFDRKEYLNRICEITGLSHEQVADYIATEHHANRALIQLIENSLKSRYKIGLLSNIGRDWINDFFSSNQLHHLFDEVVLSGEEGITKPHPAIFELMASRLGLSPSECLMIDDVRENCQGAEVAGMQSVHFTDNDQLLSALRRLRVLKPD